MKRERRLELTFEFDLSHWEGRSSEKLGPLRRVPQSLNRTDELFSQAERVDFATFATRSH